MPVSYLTGKGVKEFAGMGADIYGKAINREMDKSKLQKICRRHHGLIQEKHETAQTHFSGVCVCAECRQSRLAAA